jgi:hypothetical protein
LSDEYELVDIREGESSLTDFWRDLARAGLNHGSPTMQGTGNGWRMDPALPRRLDFQVTPSPHAELSPLSKDAEPARHTTLRR